MAENPTYDRAAHPTERRYRRSPSRILGAVFRPQHYASMLAALGGCKRPVDFILRYLRGTGTHPAVVELRTPTGTVALTAFTPDDIVTINEIFFRGDYGDDRNAKIAVDFGSNIGISAAYFLTRNKTAQVYCFEPLPQNVERLRQNMVAFEGRYELQEAAVAQQDGTAEFGWEPTGRYGGIGKEAARTMTVPAVDANRELAAIIDRHGSIDVLKIDIEMLEQELTRGIPSELAAKIRCIHVENEFLDNPLSATHSMVYRNPITTFTRHG